MKKILSIAFGLVLVLGLTSCEKENPAKKTIKKILSEKIYKQREFFVVKSPYLAINKERRKKKKC